MPEYCTISNNQKTTAASTINKSGGASMDANTKRFMESRFDTDFNNVRLHTDDNAVQLNRKLNSKAFTIGNDIYFDKENYAPETTEGKYLLAHELTHTLQQSQQPEFIQRKKYSGVDDAGFYDIDDKACSFNYRQDWYFNFGSVIEKSKQPAFMASGKSQVESGWSKKFSIITDNKSCACGDKGFSVGVELNTFNKGRDGKRGYTIDVEKRERAKTNPLTGTISMEDTADVPFYAGGPANMDIMAHEFGHTLGLEDEYNWWAKMMGVKGSDDPSSLMNVGNDVKPWHYQHFADIINQELGNCTYYPEGYTKRSSLSEPQRQLGITTGAYFKQASLDPSKAEFIIGLHWDRRVSNEAALGLFYPSIGFDTYWNANENKVTAGPTVGFKLSRIVHPLYVDVSTGLLITPRTDKEDLKLNVPASLTVGLRGKGFNAGINYTPMFDLINGGKYSHIVGLNLQFDL